MGILEMSLNRSLVYLGCVIHQISFSFGKYPATSYFEKSWSRFPLIQLFGESMRNIRRRVSTVVEHSSANPKVPGLIPGSWIMMRHVSCILLLEWSTTSQRLWVYRISVPYAQTDPRFLFEKRRGQPREFWSLVSTIDGSTLPQDCVEEQL